MVGRELAGRDRKRTIERICPGMSADDIAHFRVAEGCDHRATFQRLGGAPTQGHETAGPRRVRSEHDCPWRGVPDPTRGRRTGHWA